MPLEFNFKETKETTGNLFYLEDIGYPDVVILPINLNGTISSDHAEGLAQVFRDHIQDMHGSNLCYPKLGVPSLLRFTHMLTDRHLSVYTLPLPGGFPVLFEYLVIQTLSTIMYRIGEDHTTPIKTINMPDKFEFLDISGKIEDHLMTLDVPALTVTFVDSVKIERNLMNIIAKNK